jgi:hypothetical protein
MRRQDQQVCSIGTMGKGERVLAGTTEPVLFEHVGQGCLTHFNRECNRFSAYRFHDEDPVVFQNGLRLTCRCGETEHGRPGEANGYLDPQKTRYSTYTWVYQW